MVTIEYSVGESGDDVVWIPDGGFYTNSNLVFGKGGSYYYCIMRWSGVTIPDDVTIDAAYITFVVAQVYGIPPACTLSFEDAANPSAPTTTSDAQSRVSTSATVSITGSSDSVGTSWNSPELKTIIQELVDSYSYASGAAMICMVKCTSASNNNFSSQASWDHADYNPPLLHIEYTQNGVSVPVTLIGQRFRRIT